MKRRLTDNIFLAFEACMHIYLVVYLLSIKASLLSIGFTIFELTMFIRLLKAGVKPLEKSCGVCPWSTGKEEHEQLL